MSEEWRYVLAAMLGVCMAAGFCVAAAELVWMFRRKALHRAALREMALSLSPVPPHMLLTFLLSGVWAALFATAYAIAPLHLPMSLPVLLVCLLLTDFAYYWEHRCAHRVPWLWRAYHAMHHGAPQYTVATAYRVSPLSYFLAPAFYLPLVLIGFHPLLVAMLQQCCFHWQAWLHTEMVGELGWLDRWFNTPASHRVHHSDAPEHRDRNLGAITLWWDHLFGTYAAPSEAIVYGIADTPAPRSLLDLYTSTWRN